MRSMKIQSCFSRHTVLIGLMVLMLSGGPVFSQEKKATAEKRKAGLEKCLQEALENNHRRPASRFAIEMAEAQHRQALAGYWPQVTAQTGYSRLDEALNFKYPAATISLPPAMGGMSVSIPEQDIDIMEEKIFTGSIDATWLLYDGGMRKGNLEQAESYVEMMKQEAHRTDLEIVDSVKRYYWGAVLAEKLHRLGQDTLSRMNTTLALTEALYKQGSGRVKKTDWLSNKVMVETVRSMVALLEKNELAAQAALANTMGLSWDKSIKPEDTQIPFVPCKTDLGKIVTGAYQFNPDWGKLEAGLKAAEGGLRTARSGHFPKIALTGDLHKWWPDSDEGLATSENKEGWSLGLGLKIPIFSGMLTQNKIAAARASIAKLKEEQCLMKEAIGLQIRDTLLALSAAEKSFKATQNAMTSARENRDLNTRAYQNELVETDDVIRAQLMDALMEARHYKDKYQHIALLSHLDLIVGVNVLKNIL